MLLKTVHDPLVTKVKCIDSSKLLKKNYNTKIKEIEEKIPYYDYYITVPEFNKFYGTIFDESLKK